ncbi:MAG: hypothetical protein ABFD50_20080 [Smithella sp.]
MKIETMFNVGDKVFAIYKGAIGESTTCDECNGSGVIQLKNAYECPACKGRGYKKEKTFVPTEEVRIVFIITKTGEETSSIGYYMNSGAIFSESDCFPTISIAQAECDRRNGEMK